MRGRYKFGTVPPCFGALTAFARLRPPGTFNPSVPGSSPGRPTTKSAAKRENRAAVRAGKSPPNQGVSVQIRHSARGVS